MTTSQSPPAILPSPSSQRRDWLAQALVIGMLGAILFTVLDAALPERKAILRERMLELPAFRQLRDVIVQRGGRMSASELLSTLAGLFPAENPESLSRSIIGWGRYAEILAYNSTEKELIFAQPSST